MPFELGIDVGCKTYYRTNKKYLILEAKPHRYKKVLSDIAGQDIRHHGNQPINMVKAVRNWFRAIFPKRKTPSYTVIWDAYNEFHFDFKEQMRGENLNPDDIDELPFNELIAIMKTWIRNYK